MGKISLLSDNPVTIESKDILYENFIENIYDGILSITKENTPFVIGINGKWGAGKTSVMKILKNKIDNKNKELKKKIYLTVWFESWKYNSYELIGNALIYHLFNTISLSDKAFLKIRPEFYKEIIEITKSLPFINKFGEAVDKAIKLNQGNVDLTIYEKGFNKLLDIISEKIDKIIIFVDDLDRCSKESLLAFFEYIKLHINIPGIIFIVGMDKKNIIKELSGNDENKEHNKDYYENYLEKIIQHWYNLPKLNLIDIETIIKKYIGDEELKIIIKTGILKYLNNETPRKIKQFLNCIISNKNNLSRKLELNKIIIFSFIDIIYGYIEKLDPKGDNLFEQIKTGEVDSLKDDNEKNIKKLLKDNNISLKDLYIYLYTYTPIYGYLEAIKEGNEKIINSIVEESDDILKGLDTLIYGELLGGELKGNEKENIEKFIEVVKESELKENFEKSILLFN